MKPHIVILTKKTSHILYLVKYPNKPSFFYIESLVKGKSAQISKDGVKVYHYFYTSNSTKKEGLVYDIVQTQFQCLVFACYSKLFFLFILGSM